MTALYKVTWHALDLIGFDAIIKHAYFSTSDAANQWAGRCIDAGKAYVAIEGPAPDRCDLIIGKINQQTRDARGIRSY